MRPQLRLAIALAALLQAVAVGVQAQSSAGTVAACENQRTLDAVAQSLGVNLVLNRIDAWVFDWDFARVGFESWSRNLELGWQWDETQFAVNMFAHPYHGSLFFNAARANCLTFWESVPVTFLGAWTWEFFGETFRPSLNDFWMTGYGGVAMGEMLHRLSAAIVDEEASGAERIGREVAALLVNPLGGLNRLLRGQWAGSGSNPVDRLPDTYLARLKVGGRAVREEGIPESSSSSPTLLLDVQFGDDVETEYRAPFDVISLLAQVSPDGGGLNILRAVGRLYGTDLTSAGSRYRHQFTVNQRFDYVHNSVYRFGEQSLAAGLHSRWPIGRTGLSLDTGFGGNVVMLGAIDALAAGMGQRDIDYGPGLGGLLEVAIGRRGTTYASLYSRVRYLRSVSGAPADHTVLFSGLDVTIPVSGRMGVGAYVSAANRNSNYSDLPDEQHSYFEARVYVSWRLASAIAGAP